jgi:hypothetical protein
LRPFCKQAPMSKLQSPHNQPRWRQEMLKALDRQRVPPPWRDRLMEELEDHLSDLKESPMSMDAEHGLLAEERLGLPQELASAAAAEYRKLGFFARRPVLTYVVGPLVLMPVLFVAYLLLITTLVGGIAAGVLAVLDPGHQGPHPAGELIALATTMSFRFVPFALGAWLFCRLAQRHSRDWRWTMSACATIGIYATLIFATVQAPTASAKGMLIIGFALPPKEMLSVVQALVPLAIGALFLWRAKPRNRGYCVAAGAVPSEGVAG